METTTITSRFQIVIPKNIRQRYNIKPGQKLVFIPHKRNLRIIIVPKIEDAYGFLRGIDTDLLREDNE